MKKIDWFSPRKWSWLLNVFVYNLKRLVFRNRDSHIWVFGAKDGLIYDDNCRHFFEYINESHRDIKAVWLCANESVASRVREKNYLAYTFDSKEGVCYAQKAGVAVYSHGLSDFGLFPNVAGAYIVSLWHGVGFKRIYNASYTGVKRRLKKCMDFFFSWTWRDLTTVTSEYVREQFAEIFGVSTKQIVITGQPRNDIFKKVFIKNEVFRKLNIDFSKNVILFMPTYRGGNMGKGAIFDIVYDLYNSEILKKSLDESNSIFVVKLHPLTPHIDIDNRNNFVILDYNDVDDNQALLAVSDMLVTDYSSCCVDFALLNRPVLFYMPDYEHFIEQAEDLYDVFENLYRDNNSKTPEELSQQIINHKLDAVEVINGIYEDESIKGTCYSENVYNAIVKAIGL